jgi:hypothetical protein
MTRNLTGIEVVNMVDVMEMIKEGKHNREYNAEAKKHKDETETLEAVVYDKSMSTLCLPHGTITTAYTIVFVVDGQYAYQYLVLDKPWVYASLKKYDVCEIVVKTKAYEYPDKQYPVVSMKLLRRS